MDDLKLYLVDNSAEGVRDEIQLVVCGAIHSILVRGGLPCSAFAASDNSIAQSLPLNPGPGLCSNQHCVCLSAPAFRAAPALLETRPWDFCQVCLLISKPRCICSGGCCAQDNRRQGGGKVGRRGACRLWPGIVHQKVVKKSRPLCCCGKLGRRKRRTYPLQLVLFPNGLARHSNCWRRQLPWPRAECT